MKVRLLRDILVDHNWQPTPSGTVVDLPEDRANHYLAHGFAEPSTEPATVVLPFDPVVGTGGERRPAPMGTPTRAAEADRQAILGTSGSTQLTGAGAGQTVITAPDTGDRVMVDGVQQSQQVGTTETLAHPASGDPAVRLPEAAMQSQAVTQPRKQLQLTGKKR